MEPASEKNAPRLKEAEAHISAALNPEHGRPDTPSVLDSADRGLASSIRELITGAWRRPAWAIAATLLVVTAGVTWNLLQQDEGGRVLRGETESPSAVLGSAPRTLAPGARPDGTVELRWTRVDRAETYRAVLMSPATLEDMVTLDAVADTLCILRPTDLPASVSAGDVLLWRIEVIQGGDIIASSPTAILTVPSRP
jgi:hypothetical protein